MQQYFKTKICFAELRFRFTETITGSMEITGCGKSPWTKMKSEFIRALNGYS